MDYDGLIILGGWRSCGGEIWGAGRAVEENRGVPAELCRKIVGSWPNCAGEICGADGAVDDDIERSESILAILFGNEGLARQHQRERQDCHQLAATAAHLSDASELCPPPLAHAKKSDQV